MSYKATKLGSVCFVEHTGFSVRACNCIFGKICRIASKNFVIVEYKCLPCMYYGLEACPINKSLIKSLHFAVKSVFRKIFLIKSYDAANVCLSLSVQFLRQFLVGKLNF